MFSQYTKNASRKLMNSARSDVRERQQRDRGQEREMQPAEAPVGAGDVVQLRLLSIPEDPEREEAQEVGDEPRREPHDRLSEVLLGADRPGRPLPAMSLYKTVTARDSRRRARPGQAGRPA